MMSLKDRLDHIASVDPEGRETEPTDQDRAEFKAWVISRFGWAHWNEYQKGGWHK